MVRHDYSFPFRIDPSSRQAAQTNYPDHVRQMIRQILLTTPTERADLPEFGCGLRALIFAPHSTALDATTEIIVRQALERWLADQIDVSAVKVLPVEETGNDAVLSVRIEYTLKATQGSDQLEVPIL